MERKIKNQLPYFGYGKKVVSVLLFSAFVWIFGLFHFGINSKSNISVCWMMSPFICMLGFGLYSIISISISLLQFSSCCFHLRVMILELSNYLKEVIYKGTNLLIDEFKLKIPCNIVLYEQIRIVAPKRKEYGDLSSNIIIKLERWLKLAYNADEFELKREKISADFLSEKLIQNIVALIIKDFGQGECPDIYLFKGTSSSKNTDIKFKIENRSRGFINFYIVSDISNKKIVEDLIITKNDVQFFPVRTIGHCYSCWTEKFGIPRQSVLVPSSRGVIQLLPEFNPDFIHGLDEFSHLWIIFIFDDVPQDITINPKIRPPRMRGKSTGVYSTRTPHRVNRIGISNVKIESISGNRIYISGVDLLNGTPIIDIKPYHICDIIDKEELLCPRWVVDNIEGEFKVVIPAEVSNKLEKITEKSDLLPEEKINLHEKNLNRLKSLGGKWPFIFFKSRIEFFETVTQSLSHDVRCRQRKVNEYGGMYQIRIDSFEIHYKLNEELNTIELIDLDLIVV
ncbi:Nef associated 1 [Cryptosporidium sp. chipmunk genotype I]|uniref:Nef associated 1 n=1 Tax=Cryptosporidium sp. chipmunk genotype I TaxID=1280935 RepID=UPI00351A3CDE|nr:Nef associated 1 [Cryptosporidium sp. chipmunk genotype I]